MFGKTVIFGGSSKRHSLIITFFFFYKETEVICLSMNGMVFFLIEHSYKLNSYFIVINGFMICDRYLKPSVQNCMF